MEDSLVKIQEETYIKKLSKTEVGRDVLYLMVETKDICKLLNSGIGKTSNRMH